MKPRTTGAFVFLLCLSGWGGVVSMAEVHAEIDERAEAEYMLEAIKQLRAGNARMRRRADRMQTAVSEIRTTLPGMRDDIDRAGANTEAIGTYLEPHVKMEQAASGFADVVETIGAGTGIASFLGLMGIGGHKLRQRARNRQQPPPGFDRVPRPRPTPTPPYDPMPMPPEYESEPIPGYSLPPHAPAFGGSGNGNGNGHRSGEHNLPRESR